ncbi:uncharacterized protein LOC121803301 isoform X3 [Salvia splendens]|uniref:uncharacterized protein LOC121803301 isoform X3 n=1 Tax=Salvia splendens TaxID=180675 RepID=UPI001C276E46|nr:uncharacterized protein LOC121803301 isoform X3 [Salvia splendens]
MLPDFPPWFFMTAQKELQSNTGIQFTEAEIKQRMDFMKLRYKTFKQVQTEGASWDVGAQYLRANDDVWEKIFKLARLYGLDNVKKEGETEVVVISDQTEKISDGEPSCYEK